MTAALTRDFPFPRVTPLRMVLMQATGSEVSRLIVFRLLARVFLWFGSIVPKMDKILSIGLALSISRTAYQLTQGFGVGSVEDEEKDLLVTGFLP